jgi:hypothetical protein
MMMILMMLMYPIDYVLIKFKMNIIIANLMMTKKSLLMKIIIKYLINKNFKKCINKIHMKEEINKSTKKNKNMTVNFKMSLMKI